MIRTILLFALIGIFVNGYSQKDLKEKANDAYAKYSYNESIRKYESIKDKDITINRNLAISYYNISEYEKSEEYWKKVVEDSNHNLDDTHSYAEVLSINQKYNEANEVMKELYNTNPNDKRAIRWEKNDGLRTILKEQEDKGLFTIQNISINSRQQDFGTAYLDDKIVYASSRERNVKVIKRRWNWNKLPFLDLYVGKTDSNLNIKSVSKFRNRKINNKLHDGPAAFAKSGKYMMFTRNNYDGKSKDGVRKLQLFSAVYKDDKWQAPKAFAYNSSEYSVGHAALTENADTMYFVSDMPGGYGGTDIYMTTSTDGKTWSKPVNLGETINTEGNEMFPFIHKSGVLFFASNGLIGLGGLDIFVSHQRNGKFEKPQNIGVPINSSYDDFALITDDKQMSGFFSSNRPAGKGSDDIYSFRRTKEIVKKYLKGTAYDNERNILAGVDVTLFSENGDSLGTLITKEDGKYEFEIEKDKFYSLKGAKKGYSAAINTVDSHNDEPIIYSDLTLNKVADFSIRILVTDAGTKKTISNVNVQMTDYMKNKTSDFVTSNDGYHIIKLTDAKLKDSLSYDFKLEKQGYMTTNYSWKKVLNRPGQYDIYIEMDSEIKISPIYFDYNKSNIRNDANERLKHVAEIMNKYPTIEIELSSHTDCRGTKRYNIALSERRAKQSLKYIRDRVKENPKRIYGKGYGEERLTNGCACEGAKRSNCSEKEHQLNRRTEFKIIKM